MAILLGMTFTHWTKQPPFEFTSIPFYRPLIGTTHPNFVSAEQRIREIRTRLTELPEPTSLPTGGTTGFLGYTEPTTDEMPWVRFDWDKPRRIDAIVFVPAQAPNSLTTPNPLPMRDEYQITLLSGTQVVHKISIVTSQKLQVRETLPYFIDVPNIKATTVLVDAITKDAYPTHLCIGEFYIFSGWESIAPSSRYTAKGSSEGVLGIDLDYVCDERTSLGINQKKEDHHYVGYTAGALEYNASVWIELHLPEPQPLDEVRFYPAERELGAGINTAGYPQEMDVLVWDDKKQAMRTVYIFKNNLGDTPGLNSVPLRFPEIVTDRVRLNVRRLWKPTAKASATFALAEIELRHRGIPFNTGLKVIAHPMTQEMAPTDPRNGMKRFWSVQGLIDGMSTEGRILHERKWLELLSERGDLLVELDQREPRFEQLKKQANLFCWRITAGIPLLIFLGMFGWQIWSRIRQHKHVQRIRDQLAADLHDDLGSNLSTIQLYAQRLHRQGEADARTISSLVRLTRDSITSLKEMVSFTSPRITTSLTLVQSLENIAETHCVDIPYTFHIEAGLEYIDYPQVLRRNLRLFLKEALNNAHRHSTATRVDIRIGHDESGMQYLEIHDNGNGLPDNIIDNNSGLSTLRLRAQDMHTQFSATNDKTGGCRIRINLSPIK
jgi:signal transduction histidine kinase